MGLNEKVHLKCRTIIWEDFQKWWNKVCRDKSPVATHGRMILVAFMYVILLKRNTNAFKHEDCRPDVLVDRIMRITM